MSAGRRRAQRVRRDLLALRSRFRRAGRSAAGRRCRPAVSRAAPIRALANPRHQAAGVQDLPGARGFRGQPWRQRFSRPARPIWPATCRRRASTARGWNPRPSSTATRCIGRSNQHRRTREHERGDADRQDSRLGTSPDRKSIRDPPHRRRVERRERDGLGHARLFRRRHGPGTDPGPDRQLRIGRISSVTSTSARRRRHPAASRCITIVGVTPEAETLEMAFGPNRASRDVQVREEPNDAGPTIS